MSKGNAPKERAKLLVKVLLEYEGKQEDEPITDLRVTWLKKVDRDLMQKEVAPVLRITATKQSLFYLVKDIKGFRPKLDTTDERLKQIIGEVLVNGLDRHLGIFEEQEKNEKRRQEDRALGFWKFTLKLWDRNDVPRNLQELDRLWESKRSPQSSAQVATTPITEGRPESAGEVVAAGVRENARLRGFNDV